MVRNTSFKIALAVMLGAATLSTQAASVQEARGLYEAGKYKSALAQTDTLLKADPNNVLALFLKAQIHTDRQRIDTAIDLYKKLLSVSPGHLQAYNNLAALYAQKGQLELAADTLEKAIRTDPVFTTIHTNLRTIYMDMSQKHYRQALKLKTEDKPTQIAAIDVNEGVDQILSQEIEVVPQSIQEAVNTSVTSSAAPKPVQPVVASAPEKAPKKPVAAAKPQPKPTPKPKADPVREIKKALLAWANAWSNRDAQKYVSAYLNTYATPGKTNKDWAAGRRWNFKNKKYIKVELSDIHIKAEGDRYRASFTQQYESDNYRDVVDKELLFVRQAGRWKIAKEVTS